MRGEILTYIGASTQYAPAMQHRLKLRERSVTQDSGRGGSPCSSRSRTRLPYDPRHGVFESLDASEQRRTFIRHHWAIGAPPWADIRTSLPSTRLTAGLRMTWSPALTPSRTSTVVPKSRAT